MRALNGSGRAALRLGSALAMSGLRLLYPPQCLSCKALTGSDFALCGDCWRETPFITGPCCHYCGLPVPAPGAADANDMNDLICEGCHAFPPPWAAARAAMLYQDQARRMVLALKHGDRLDLARPMGRWLARAARPLLTPETLILAVPLHRWRLFRRRYNQAALLAQALAKATALPFSPDALIRPQATPPLEHHDRAARFAALSGAIRASPRGAARIRGREVVIVDDVMTSGATLSSATLACYAAGATRVCVLPLARVAKET